MNQKAASSSYWINAIILTTIQPLYYCYCREKIDVDKEAWAMDGSHSLIKPMNPRKKAQNMHVHHDQRGTVAHFSKNDLLLLLSLHIYNFPLFFTLSSKFFHEMAVAFVDYIYKCKNGTSDLISTVLEDYQRD